MLVDPHTSDLGLAHEVVTELVRSARTVSCAESLTGGLLCATLTEVPGASECVRGAVVSYATELKATMLGVEIDLLARTGPVHEEVARQMARGVAAACGSEIGVSTTGVAGPTEQDGVPIGTVFICASSADGSVEQVRHLQLTGDRSEIRRQSVRAAMELVLSLSRQWPAQQR